MIYNERTKDYEVNHFLTRNNEEVEITSRGINVVTICIRGWKEQPYYTTVSQEYLDNAIATGSLTIDEERYLEVSKARRMESRPSDNWYRPVTEQKPKKKNPSNGKPRRSHSPEEFRQMLAQIG